MEAGLAVASDLASQGMHVAVVCADERTRREALRVLAQGAPGKGVVTNARGFERVDYGTGEIRVIGGYTNFQGRTLDAVFAPRTFWDQPVPQFALTCDRGLAARAERLYDMDGVPICC